MDQIRCRLVHGDRDRQILLTVLFDDLAHIDRREEIVLHLVKIDRESVKREPRIEADIVTVRRRHALHGKDTLAVAVLLQVGKELLVKHSKVLIIFRPEDRTCLVVS